MHAEKQTYKKDIESLKKKAKVTFGLIVLFVANYLKNKNPFLPIYFIWAFIIVFSISLFYFLY